MTLAGLQDTGYDAARTKKRAQQKTKGEIEHGKST